MEVTVRKGLSAAVLKAIALVTMTIDHVTAIVLKDYLKHQGILNYYSNDWYMIGRVIGRIAFVLYAFMIAEGAARTKHKTGYAVRLLILALISEVPCSFADTGKWFDKGGSLNIFFLLVTGLVTIYALEWLKQTIRNAAVSVILRLAVTAAACALALLCKFEYGMMGILLILAFYVFRDNFPRMAAAVTLVMSIGYMANVILSHNAILWIQKNSAHLISAILNTDRIQIFGLLALPIIFFYNGKKGRQLPKLFYYLYYPVHLAILGIIVYVL